MRVDPFVDVDVEAPSARAPQRYPNAAAALLAALKAQGVDYLFAGSGSDWAPIVEAYADPGLDKRLLPEPVICPHETSIVAMAHGYYLRTGKPQAAMVHVNVGLANAAMGMLNAASDNVPLIMMSGRSPATEHERLGARCEPIHWGQDMRDQAALVRESAKWDFELRYGEQVVELAARAMAIASSEPTGPVYLSLPREALCEPFEGPVDPGAMRKAPSSVPHPDPAAIAIAADWLAAAKRPVVLAPRGDPAGETGAALAALADAFALPVVEFWPVRNNLASSHPMHGGHVVDPWLEDADVVLVLDTLLPWIRNRNGPAKPDCRIIQAGRDPQYTRTPVHGFAADLAVAGTALTVVRALHGALRERVDPGGNELKRRRNQVSARIANLRFEAARAAEAGSGSPIGHAWVSHCLTQAMSEQVSIFSELGIPPQNLGLRGPNQYHQVPLSGGLGWAFPAALGAQLADRERLCVATVGDGCYLFSNPVANHQIAEALRLPVLVIVLNNGVWNAVRHSTLAVYPKGHAAKLDRVPVTGLQPSPDIVQIARASRAWAKRVEKGSDLLKVLRQAVRVVREERRQALVEVNTVAPY